MKEKSNLNKKNKMQWENRMFKKNEIVLGYLKVKKVY